MVSSLKVNVILCTVICWINIGALYNNFNTYTFKTKLKKSVFFKFVDNKEVLFFSSKHLTNTYYVFLHETVYISLTQNDGHIISRDCYKIKSC